MNSYRRIASVKTACEILEFLSEQDGPVPVLEISKTLEIPQGTVMCHLITLEDVGFVERNNDTYKLGYKLGLFWAQTMNKLQAKKRNIERQIEMLETGVSNE